MRTKTSILVVYSTDITTELPEVEFFTCLTCDDYDLCTSCLISNKHGHHPGHAFKAVDEQPKPSHIETACMPARNIRHDAICDKCDKQIYGVRHKCLQCPDFDMCSNCIGFARQAHPAHRFVPIYVPLPEPRGSKPMHNGICCDGPTCKKLFAQPYIVGTRYKCAVCPDFDLCGNCEALPIRLNEHNPTHPMIKFKTPVVKCTIETIKENQDGTPLKVMGDFCRQRTQIHAQAQQIPCTAAQMQTVADIKPSEKIRSDEMNSTHALPDLPDVPTGPLHANSIPPAPSPDTPKNESIPARDIAKELKAFFVRDNVADGTVLPPASRFQQYWVIRNPGPHAWPAGCSVRYVGGDNMLDLDDQPQSTAFQVTAATETNVVDREVQPGEEVSFSVYMKTGRREGRSISYWRLKDKSGVAFGHKLWCDIVVKSASPSSAIRMPRDSRIAMGQAYQSSANAAFRNQHSSNSTASTDSWERAQSQLLEKYDELHADLKRVGREIGKDFERKMLDEMTERVGHVDAWKAYRESLGQDFRDFLRRNAGSQLDGVRKDAEKLAATSRAAAVCEKKKNEAVDDAAGASINETVTVPTTTQALEADPQLAQKTKDVVDEYEKKTEMTEHIVGSASKSPASVSPISTSTATENQARHAADQSDIDTAKAAGVSVANTAAEAETHKSQLLFPTLPKESPSSSVHSAQSHIRPSPSGSIQTTTPQQPLPLLTLPPPPPPPTSKATSWTRLSRSSTPSASTRKTRVRTRVRYG